MSPSSFVFTFSSAQSSHGKTAASLIRAARSFNKIIPPSAVRPCSLFSNHHAVRKPPSSLLLSHGMLKMKAKFRADGPGSCPYFLAHFSIQGTPNNLFFCLSNCFWTEMILFCDFGHFLSIVHCFFSMVYTFLNAADRG